MTFAIAQADGPQAASELCGWVKQRYDLDWTVEDISELSGSELHAKLVAEATDWFDNGKLEKTVDVAMEKHREPKNLAEWVENRFGKTLDLESVEQENLREEVLTAGRAMLRTELGDLERYVLLQILDSAWKDHLYSMDQLKDSVGLRGFAEKDPRIEYKREGSDQFSQMQVSVRDRVTDLIYRAKLTPNIEQRNVYGEQETKHEEATSALASGGAAAAGTAEQQADMAAAERAGGRDEYEGMSRKQRRSAQARDRKEQKRPAKQRKRRSR
jgi:preprotein translocase subunit SecA